jgi:hypothetical protein
MRRNCGNVTTLSTQKNHPSSSSNSFLFLISIFRSESKYFSCDNNRVTKMICVSTILFCNWKQTRWDGKKQQQTDLTNCISKADLVNCHLISNFTAVATFFCIKNCTFLIKLYSDIWVWKMIVLQRYGYHNYEEHDYLMTSGCIFKRSFKQVSFIIFTFRQFLFCCLTKSIDIGTKLGQHFGGENLGFMYNVGC